MKKIIILSPDCWGVMKVSKMHFAIELANMGNYVYFVNPPRFQSTKQMCYFEELPEHKNIALIHTRENRFRVPFREKSFLLFKFIENQYIRCIKEITGDVDEIWNFNPQFIAHTNKFGAQINLLLMYDFFCTSTIYKAAACADAIISVAQNILDSFKNVRKPKLLLKHGLADSFTEEAKNETVSILKNSTIKIGYTGNLFHPAIDRQFFQSIINDHAEVEFHIWGAYRFQDNNLSTSDVGGEIRYFIEFLMRKENVTLHGVRSPEDLAKEIRDMSAFLILYNANLDINAASNSHKIIEYLSTGKPVFSMFVSEFENSDLLIQDSRESNNFPAFFSRNLRLLDNYNSNEKQQKRIEFALSNTYKKQIERIEEFVQGIKG